MNQTDDLIQFQQEKEARKKKNRRILLYVFLGFVIAPVVFGVFYSALRSEEGKAKDRLGSIRSHIAETEDANSLSKLVLEIDSLATVYPSLQTTVDELKANEIQQRQMAIEKEEVSIRLFKIYEYAKKAVSDKLKSPSTAKFQDYNDIESGVTEDGQYITRFYVDAQNSFGAMIREKYEVIVVLNKKTGSYDISKFQKI